MSPPSTPNLAISTSTSQPINHYHRRTDARAVNNLQKATKAEPKTLVSEKSPVFKSYVLMEHPAIVHKKLCHDKPTDRQHKDYKLGDLQLGGDETVGCSFTTADGWEMIIIDRKARSPSPPSRNHLRRQRRRRLVSSPTPQTWRLETGSQVADDGGEDDHWDDEDVLWMEPVIKVRDKDENDDESGDDGLWMKSILRAGRSKGEDIDGEK